MNLIQLSAVTSFNLNFLKSINYSLSYSLVANICSNVENNEMMKIFFKQLDTCKQSGHKR